MLSKILSLIEIDEAEKQPPGKNRDIENEIPSAKLYKNFQKLSLSLSKERSPSYRERLDLIRKTNFIFLCLIFLTLLSNIGSL